MQTMKIEQQTQPLKCGRMFKEVFAATLQWLVQEGFINSAGAFTGQRVCLTTKALAALNTMPTNLEGKTWQLDIRRQERGRRRRAAKPDCVVLWRLYRFARARSPSRLAAVTGGVIHLPPAAILADHGTILQSLAEVVQRGFAGGADAYRLGLIVPVLEREAFAAGIVEQAEERLLVSGQFRLFRRDCAAQREPQSSP